LRSIISIPAVNPCAPLKAQPWGDVIRRARQRVSSAGMLSEVGKRRGAPVARTVPWSVPLCRAERAGQGPSSRPTDKVEAARAAGAIPAAVAPPVAGTPVEVEASPAGAAQHTQAAVVAEASPAEAAVAPFPDTTNPPSHCSC